MDGLLFGAFPYVALTIFVVGTIIRYRGGFQYSSLSSQFLESKKIYNGKNVIRTEIDKYTEKDIINEIREVLNNTNVK